MTKDLRVNADRMLTSFNQLALIGATAEGGVHRPTFHEAHLAARQWFREEVQRSGLEFRTDGAGNHSAFLPVIASPSGAKQSPPRHGETLAPGASAGVSGSKPLIPAL